MAVLRVLNDPSGKTLELKSEFTIGRSSGNSLELAGDAVSRNHARISHSEGVYTLVDLGSSNGTHVEREGRRWQVAPDVTLRDGDIITIGTAELRFEAGLGTEAGMAGTAKTMVGRLVPPREQAE